MIIRDVSVTNFKAHCTSMLRDIADGKYSVRVTKRGRTVAVVDRPREASRPGSWLGSLKGSVLRYERPLDPAASPSDWESAS